MLVVFLVFSESNSIDARLCRSYDSITGLQGVCKDILVGKFVSFINKEDIINFTKVWSKTEHEIDQLVGLIEIGKDDLGTLRQLISNYITIFFEIHITLPPLDQFKTIVKAILEPSFTGCRTAVKRIACETAFKLCGVPKGNCIKECEDAKNKNCKHQLAAMNLIAKLRPGKQHQLSCPQLCRNKI